MTLTAVSSTTTANSNMRSASAASRWRSRMTPRQRCRTMPAKCSPESTDGRRPEGPESLDNTGPCRSSFWRLLYEAGRWMPAFRGAVSSTTGPFICRDAPSDGTASPLTGGGEASALSTSTPSPNSSGCSRWVGKATAACSAAGESFLGFFFPIPSAYLLGRQARHRSEAKRRRPGLTRLDRLLDLAASQCKHFVSKSQRVSWRLTWSTRSHERDGCRKRGGEESAAAGRGMREQPWMY